MKSPAIAVGAPLPPASSPVGLPSGVRTTASRGGDCEPAVASSALLRGRKAIQIEHNGAVYQLRATKFGKLILTK